MADPFTYIERQTKRFQNIVTNPDAKGVPLLLRAKYFLASSASNIALANDESFPKLMADVNSICEKAEHQFNHVIVTDERSMRIATSAGNALIVSQGYLDRATPRESRSSIAHEVGHQKLGHFGPLKFIGIASALTVYVGAVMLENRFNPTPHSARSSLYKNVSTLAKYALAFRAESYVSAPLSRKLEYQADDFAVRLTEDPEARISILEKYRGSKEPEAPKGITEKLKSWEQQLRRTHPSIDDRIDRVHAITREMSAEKQAAQGLAT